MDNNELLNKISEITLQEFYDNANPASIELLTNEAYKGEPIPVSLDIPVVMVITPILLIARSTNNFNLFAIGESLMAVVMQMAWDKMQSEVPNFDGKLSIPEDK